MPTITPIGDSLADQSAIAHAINAIASKKTISAKHMLATLDLLLAGVRVSPQQESAWIFSTLSGNGYPLEFTFSSMEDNIRYVVEATGPEIDPRDRLSHVKDLLTKLDSPHPFVEPIKRFQQIQGGHPLKWGAWLGVRHSSQQDDYKIYAEVPQAGSAIVDDAICQTFGHRPLLPNGMAIPTAVGHQLGSSWSEYYFIINQMGLTFSQIQSLLWRVGLYEQSRALLELIQETRGYSDLSTAPGFMPAKYGFSYAVSKAGRPIIFSFFTFARRLIGSDANIRRNLLAVAERRGWNLDAYAALTAPLEDRNDQCEYHNVIAYIVAPQRQVGLHVSLSPPKPFE